MADIKIQPKKTSPISYILYAVALLAIIFMIVKSLTDSKKPVETTAVVVDTSRVAGSVMEFVAFLNGTSGVGNKEDTERSPQYTSYGLHLLTAAIGATADRDAATDNNIIQHRKRLQQMSDSIQNNWSPTEKSGRIKAAFVSAANLLNSIQEKKYPELNDQAAQLMQYAQAIVPQKRIMDQKAEVKRYFDQSKSILQAMVQKSKSTEAKQ